MWILAGLLANVGIMFVEYINRTQDGNFFQVLPVTIGPIMIAQFGLWYSWSHAPSMMLAWICFTVGNNTLRIANSYLVGEPFNVFYAAGLSLAIAGACFIKHGASIAQ